MPNPSEWVSFMEYLGLSGDELQRLDAEAAMRTAAAEQEAQQKLAIAGQEAQSGLTSVTRTASYGDFLTAQREAQQAAIRRAAPTGNPYEDAAREALGIDKPEQGVTERLRAAEAGWQQRASQRVSDVMAGKRRAEAEKRAREEALAAQRRDYEAKQKEMGYDEASGAAYRDWAASVDAAARRGGGIGASAYFDPSVKVPGA